MRCVGRILSRRLCCAGQDAGEAKMYKHGKNVVKFIRFGCVARRHIVSSQSRLIFINLHWTFLLAGAGMSRCRGADSPSCARYRLVAMEIACHERGRSNSMEIKILLPATGGRVARRRPAEPVKRQTAEMPSTAAIKSSVDSQSSRLHRPQAFDKLFDQTKTQIRWNQTKAINLILGPNIPERRQFSAANDNSAFRTIRQ